MQREGLFPRLLYVTKKAVLLHAMMACQTEKVQVHAFLTQQDMGVSGQLHVPTALA